MKNILIAMTIVAAVLSSAASAQTFAPKYGQKIILSGSGNDIANTLTLQTPVLGSGGYTLTFPGTSTNGPLFNTAGTLSWATQSAMLSFLGLTGSSGSNTGDVTLAGPGSYLSLTGQQINQALITYGNIQLVGANKILGNNTASPASVTELTASDVKTFLNLTGTNSGDVTLAGQNYLSIAGQVITANPVNLSGTNVTGQLPYGGIQNETNNTLLGNTSGIAAPPSEQTPATIKTLLNLTGTNSGDVTVAGPGTYLTLTGQQINQALITYANMQAVSTTSKLLGSSATTTAVQEITIGSGLSMSGSTLSATAGLSGGVANTIPVWTSATAIGNSSITDNATDVSTGENLKLTGSNKILSFKGDGTGVSTFAAGVQGATSFNYTLPTTLPSANQVLTATAVSAPSVTLGWTTPTVGGTLSGLTANGAMYATGATTAASTGAMTNGQLLIGSTGNPPVAATLTAGSGVTITNGAGTITLSSSTPVLFARRTSDLAISTGSAAADDPQLTVAVAANATYEFSGVIAYDGNNAASDLQIAFNTPAASTIRWSIDQGGTAMTPSSMTGSGGATASISPFKVDGTTPTNDQTIFFSGVLVTGANAGNLTVQEGRVTAANTTTILTNSHLKATRVQ